jgi:NitT/TauT family transport system substrate-binding protein
MATTRRAFLKTVGIGILAGTAGAPGHVAAQQVTSFKIGSVVLDELATTGPILVGIDKGFFRQNGLAVEMVPFKGGPDQLKGLLAGAVQLAISGSTDLLVFRERGTSVRAVAVTTEKNHFTLVVASKITKSEDLKGGTIAVTAPGATSWVFARMLAKKMGWDPEKDIRIVGVGGQDAMVAGMRRGELTAFVTGTAGVVAEAQGVGRVLMRLDEATPRWVSNMAFTTDEIIKTRRDDVEKAVRGLFLAIKFMRDNPDETIRIAVRGIGWPEGATRRAYELLRPLLPADGRFDPDTYRIVQETLLELGVLKKRLPLEDHYTTEFTPVKA